MESPRSPAHAGEFSPPISAPPALAVDAVRQVYGAVRAVDGVSWEARPGEVLCLLGHSGCGKTTLLRLIAGVEAPTAGRILLDGELVAGPGRFVPAERRRVGLVFQDYALFPHLSVRDNVAFGLPRGVGPHVVDAALARVGLGRLGAQFPHTLSGGEQQRVALARALAPGPRVLLMDEPFSNLDRRLRDQVREDTMAVLREAGATAVVVTHDPEEALRIADRVVLLSAGQVVQQGAPRELYARPTSLFAARFFSELNEIEAVCEGGMARSPLGAFPAPGQPEGARLRVCLRPQALRPAAPGAGLQGQVVQAAFLGDAEHLQVALPGLPTPLSLRCPPGGAGPGDAFHLEILRDQALVFAEPPAPSTP